MSISDWSSDVCSSDLLIFSAIANGIDVGIAGPAGGIHLDAAPDGQACFLRQTGMRAQAHGREHGVRLNDRAVIQIGADTRSGRVDGNDLAAQMPDDALFLQRRANRSDEHTAELQSLMRISYAVTCLKTKKRRRNP